MFFHNFNDFGMVDKSLLTQQIVRFLHQKIVSVMGSPLSGTSATWVRGREFSMLSVATMMAWKGSDVSFLSPGTIIMIRLAFWRSTFPTHHPNAISQLCPLSEFQSKCADCRDYGRMALILGLLQQTFCRCHS